MKKFLMGTSAIVGVTMLAGQAVAAEDPSVSVSGFVDFNMGAGSSDTAGNGNSGFDTDSEIAVSASGKADNGLEYGAKIEIQGDEGDGNTADENYLWVSGAWGKVEMGNQDGAADQLAVTGPTAGTGGATDGDAGGYAGAGSDWQGGRKAGDTNDATKITYLGSAGAVSFGVSYTPQSGADESSAYHNDDKNNHQNAYELGVKYSGEANGMGYSVGAAYSGGDKHGTTTDDLDSWQIGVSVTSGAFTVGGSYVDNGSDADTDGYQLAGAYSTGPWTVALDYASFDDGTGDDDTAVGVAFTYDVAPGLYVGGDVISFDEDGVDGEAVVFTTGVSF